MIRTQTSSSYVLGPLCSVSVRWPSVTAAFRFRTQRIVPLRLDPFFHWFSPWRSTVPTLLQLSKQYHVNPRFATVPASKDGMDVMRARSDGPGGASRKGWGDGAGQSKDTNEDGDELSFGVGEDGAEAELNTFQKTYLLLRSESIKVDKRIIPSSTRSSSLPASPLPPQLVPLLIQPPPKAQEIFKSVLP
ncbi:hypothetical protein EV361DRAFT_872438 [Lentinula raphanica]|nr:hypothetical protein EV361DRAFT_872438 [Lentinula raphanica]